MSQHQVSDEWPYVSAQLIAEAAEDNRSCFFCNAPPPGLLFQPSEVGVSEMPLWLCPGCIADHP